MHLDGPIGTEECVMHNYYLERQALLMTWKKLVYMPHYLTLNVVCATPLSAMYTKSSHHSHHHLYHRPSPSHAFLTLGVLNDMPGWRWFTFSNLKSIG